MDHPGAGGQPAGGVVVVPVEAAAPAAPAAAGAWPVWTRVSARVVLAAALFLLGFAAAALALFAMILGKACAAPTDAEVATLRTASECLLLAASAQVVVATMALLVPARLVAFFGNLLGVLTAYHTIDVLVKLVASCDGSAHGDLDFHFWVFFIVLWPAFAVCAFVSLH